MKLFNKLTGNDVLDKLFSEFNKDILRIKRNLKEETQRFEERSIELKDKKTEKEKVEAIHSRLKKRIKHIKELNEKYSKLLELKQLQEKNEVEKQNVAKKLKVFNFPQLEQLQQLTSKIDRFTMLLTHKNATEKVEIVINRVSSQLKDLKPLSVDLSELRGKIQRFDTIKSIYEKITQNHELFSSNQRKLKIVQKDTQNCINRYKALLKEAKICPICQNVCTEEHLKEIKL